MSAIKFTMAARCAAAGRQNNEDNFQLSDNLSGDQWGFVTDRETDLDEKGALIVVCDGMGGMNAGATASALAVKTVKEWFAADRLTSQVMASPATVRLYIEQAIIAADNKIKEDGSRNREHEGMGSTIVLVWIVDQTIHVGWCGDSRAYRYNPVSGLERLSKDHSYVQELVDRGKLSQELAFDHPDGNIITRSLGDTRQTVSPDVKSFPLCDGDIILLCSDGLSGTLRDGEIEALMADSSDGMENCRNALWTASENAGWTDNVTIALCRIISGSETKEKPVAEPAPEQTAVKPAPGKRKRKMAIWTAVIALLLGIAVTAGYLAIGKGGWPTFIPGKDAPALQTDESEPAVPDSLENSR